MRKLAMLGMLALSQCAWEPVAAAVQDDPSQCATIADETVWAENEGMGEPIDHTVGNAMIRVRKHDDHYDLVLFVDNCVVAVRTDQTIEQVNQLLKAFEGQGI